MEGQTGSELASSERDTARAEEQPKNEPRVAEATPVLSTPPLASARPSAARLSWPPPRLPPRPSTQPGIEPSSESSPPPPPPSEPQVFDAQFSLAGSRTPSGEIRISQIRDLLFGDVQHQYDQRLTTLEAQLELLQAEARTRLGVMESSVVGEIGGAISTLTARVVANESATHEDTTRLDERVNALEDIFGHRLDSVEQEVRSLRSDLDALTEGLRLEVRDTIAHFEAQLRHEVEHLVMQRVHQEIGHVFLAIGGSMRKRAVAEQAAITGDLARAHDASAEAPTALPNTAGTATDDGSGPAHAAHGTHGEPGVVELSAAAVHVTDAQPPMGDGPGGLTELERWAEELSSGDIPILDPELVG